MRAFLAAWGFLTAIPLPKTAKIKLKDLESSTFYFPMVGLVIGLLAAFFDLGIRSLFPPMVASALVVLFLLGVSGAFHLDGLADTADGFLSSRPREGILEIMRDSRCGTMGVVAIVSVFALKWAVLYELPAGHRFLVLILVPLLGRCNALFLMNLVPYVREENGLAAVFMKKKSATSIVLGYSIAAFFSLYFLKAQGGVIFFAALLFAVAFSRYCLRKIGGFTGDTLGAVCELTELLVLLLALILERSFTP